MDSFHLNTILQFVWPMITVAQVVACSIALRRIGGTGPLLMTIGTVTTLLVIFYARYRNSALDLSYDSQEMMTSVAVEQATRIGARILFLVGLLLMVLRAPTTDSSTDRVSMKF